MNVAKQNVFYHTVQSVFRSGRLKATHLFSGEAPSNESHYFMVSVVCPTKLAAACGRTSSLVIWGDYHVY